MEVDDMVCCGSMDGGGIESAARDTGEAGSDCGTDVG